MKKHYTILSRLIYWGCLIMLIMMAVACTVTTTSEDKSVSLSTKIILNSHLVLSSKSIFSPPVTRGSLRSTVTNLSKETFDVDVWADVVDGIVFVQKVGAWERQISFSGLTMRPGEIRVIDIQFNTTSETVPGTYIINIHVSVPAKEINIDNSVKLIVDP